MNKRHRRTLNAIFSQPISGNIKWRDVEALLKALGAIISERTGSRVAVRTGLLRKRSGLMIELLYFTAHIRVRIWIRAQ